MIIDTKHAPKAIGPYVQAVSTGNLLFISGCCPFKPEDGNRKWRDYRKANQASDG